MSRGRLIEILVLLKSDVSVKNSTFQGLFQAMKPNVLPGKLTLKVQIQHIEWFLSYMRYKQTKKPKDEKKKTKKK